MTKSEPEQMFDDLLPGIELNVRNHDMLEPALIVKLTDGAMLPVAMGMFFHKDRPGLKDVIMPIIEIIFKNEGVAMVAMIAECWLGPQMSKEEAEAFNASQDSVEGLEGRREGVMVNIYNRGRRDEMFALEIEEGRTGVKPYRTTDNSHSIGRFVRQNPSDN
jgi:hypothetical protein